MKKKTIRVQLEMPPATFALLNELKIRDDAASYAEVIRRLIRKEHFYWKKVPTKMVP